MQQFVSFITAYNNTMWLLLYPLEVFYYIGERVTMIYILQGRQTFVASCLLYTKCASAKGSTLQLPLGKNVSF